MTEAEKKKCEDLQKAIDKFKKNWTKAFTEPLPKRNEIDYMCKDCEKCIFYSQYHDMGATEHLCKAHKPYNFYDEHTMSWVSAYDCERDKELRQFYMRDCNEFVSKMEVINKALKKIKNDNL